MQISHAESEAEVLISNLSDLQSAFYFSKAKVQDFLTSSIKMEEMNKDVLELVDDFNKKMSLKKVESTQLDDKLYDLQVRMGIMISRNELGWLRDCQCQRTLR